METAISIPNNLYILAEEFAKKHGLSRNELYASAISEYMKKKKRFDEDEIIKKINKTVQKTDTSLDPLIETATRRILLDSEW